MPAASTPTAVRRMLAGLLVAVLALLVAGCGDDGNGNAVVGGVSRPDNHGYHGSYVDPPYDVPQVRLTTDSGEDFTLADDDRPVDVVFFGYTNCPDVCQVVMGTITSAYLRIPEEDRDRVRVLFVTTDPARDDEATLTSYLERFDPAFTGLTGDIDDIDALGKPMGIFIKKGAKLPSGGYEVDHSTTVLGITGGEAKVLWTGGTSATDMAEDIQRLLEEA